MRMRGEGCVGCMVIRRVKAVQLHAVLRFAGEPSRRRLLQVSVLVLKGACRLHRVNVTRQQPLYILLKVDWSVTDPS